MSGEADAFPALTLLVAACEQALLALESFRRPLLRPRSWLSGCKPASMSFSSQDVSPTGTPRKKVSANSGNRFWEVVKPEVRCLYVPPWR
jgi:hypothetical protein